MLDHAQSHPRSEVCGLLGGKGGLITNYYPVENIAADRNSSFLMDPSGQLRVMRLMKERCESMSGIFHTHPYSPAQPSARDHDEARYRDVYYLIISLMRSKPELSAFYFDGVHFENVTVIVGSDRHHRRNQSRKENSE